MKRRERLRPSRSTPPDPLVVAVGAVALLTYALHGVNGALTRDLGVYGYAGQQVADGVPPYLGVLNRAGPLAHLLPAVGVGLARLGGFDELLGMRLVFMAIATVCTSLVYVLGRDVFRSSLAGLVTAGAFLTFTGFIRYAADGPREKTPMTLFVVCALWAVSRQRWFTAGLSVSLATLCLQIAFFPSVTATVVGVLLLAGGHRVRALILVVLGGALPVAACTVYFAVVGSLREAVDAFLLINAEYTEPDPLLPKLGIHVRDLVAAYGASVWLLLVGSVALVVLPIAFARLGITRDGRGPRVLTAFALALVGGLLWDLRDYDAWPDLFPLLPLAAVGVGGLFVWATSRLARRSTLVVAVALLVAATGAAVQASVTTRDDRLVTQRRSVAAVLALLPADATVTSIEAPQPLVLTGRTNPTRYQMFSGGLTRYVDDTWPGGLRAFRQQLVDQPTTLVSLGDTMSSTWRRGLAPTYQYIGRAPGWLWYARSSLGADKLSALREAAGDA
jgi:hypothetical protein